MDKGIPGTVSRDNDVKAAHAKDILQVGFNLQSLGKPDSRRKDQQVNISPCRIIPCTGTEKFDFGLRIVRGDNAGDRLCVSASLLEILISDLRQCMLGQHQTQHEERAGNTV